MDTVVLETLIAENTVVLRSIEELLVQNNELLMRSYAATLFCIGVTGAVGVVILLYNFLRKFF